MVGQGLVDVGLQLIRAGVTAIETASVRHATDRYTTRLAEAYALQGSLAEARDARHFEDPDYQCRDG